MRTLTIIGAALLLLASTGESRAQTPPPQGTPPAPPAGERGQAPQRPPLLPTPPLTAPPTPDTDGNFVIGPPYTPAPELTVKDGVPKGTVREFTMDSKDSKIYSGHRPQPARRGRAVHAPGRRLCSRAVRRRHAGAVHRRAGRHVTDLPEQPAADPRQPHSREARAADGRRHGPQRRRRRPGQPARAGIRHRLGRLHRFHRDRSAAANHEGLRDRVHQGSRGARDHGRQFRRGLCVHDGVVPSGALSPRALVLGNVRESAVAAQSRVAARRVGVSRHA